MSAEARRHRPTNLHVWFYFPGRQLLAMSDCDDMPPLEDDEFEPHVESPEILRVSNDDSINSGDASEDSDNDDDDNEITAIEDDWEDKVFNEMKCLFCSSMLPTVQLALAHMKENHSFDLVSYLCKFNVDQFGYIKFINYVRQEKPSSHKLMAENVCKWGSDTYMRPVIEDDTFLMCDVNDLLSRQEDCNSEEFLRSACEELKDIVIMQNESMKRMLQILQSKVKDKGPVTVGDLKPEEDEGYFSSYDHLDIHLEMLSDTVRTESYRNAILGNSDLLNGKRVLDLGCGTAILSMFSAKAGAIVTGVDMSDMINQAIDIVRENNLNGSISLHKGRLEDFHFKKKFDYIVSEWMGYFLLFEGMLDSVLYARDKFLAEGGMLLPNRCTMHIAGMEDLDSYSKLVSFWDDVYGFKMSCMQKDVIKTAATDIVKKKCIVTTAAQIADFDLMKITSKDTEFTTNFELVVKSNSEITGFVGYFDTYFDLPNPVFFSTGPYAIPTHWKQTVFYLPRPHPVKEGEILQGTISVCRMEKAVRSLEVRIQFGNQKLKYFVQ